MKKVVLKIEDSAFEDFKHLVALCPSVEIVSEYSEEEVRRDVDICIAEAIEMLREDDVIHRQTDYTYIMQVINEKKVEGAPRFASSDDFLRYLKEIGLQSIPGRSSIFGTVKIMQGAYPHWTFPNIDAVETLRRNNVARLFLNAFGRAQRGRSDEISDKA